MKTAPNQENKVVAAHFRSISDTSILAAPVSSDRSANSEPSSASGLWMIYWILQARASPAPIVVERHGNVAFTNHDLESVA